ncbi:MAG: LON peptidase substrate-binding domain-containing protein [Desulfobacterales bacterium]|nr:LON peptidase substrate-binding domain-containing protein [Desulfobacterales bacterium]
MQDSNEHTEVLRNIPLIPLRDLVVFPATLVPFIVGRSSSIQALEKAAEKDKMIFLAAQMDASVDNPTPKDIYSVGVTAKIIRTIKSDDRNMKVIVEGKSRARIVEYLSTYPYYQILAKVVKEVDDHLPESRRSSSKRVLALFEDYLKLNQNTNLDSIIPALRENTPERITDIIASHVYMPLEEKQNLLETVNSFERLRRLNYVLENEILKIHSAYQKDPNRGPPADARSRTSRPARSLSRRARPAAARKTSPTRSRSSARRWPRPRCPRTPRRRPTRRSSGWRPCRPCRPRPRSAGTTSTGSSPCPGSRRRGRNGSSRRPSGSSTRTITAWRRSRSASSSTCPSASWSRTPGASSWGSSGRPASARARSASPSPGPRAGSSSACPSAASATRPRSGATGGPTSGPIPAASSR